VTFTAEEELKIDAESLGSNVGSLATTKKAIYVPSNKPMADMSTKERITELPSGTPSHMVDSLALKGSSQGHHRAKAKDDNGMDISAHHSLTLTCLLWFGEVAYG
jgi:hypothetical protein